MEKLFGARYRFLYVPLILGSLVASVYLLQILFGFLSQYTQILIIIFIAWVITVVLRPIFIRLSKSGLSIISSVLLTFIIFFLILASLLIYVLPLLISELINIGKIIASLNVPQLAQNLFLGYHLDSNTIKDTLVNPINSSISFIVSNSISTASALLSVMFSMVLAFFFAFFMIQSGGDLNRYFVHFIPKDFRNDYLIITRALDNGLSSFIKGQVLISIIYAVIVMFAMNLLGLHFILVAGIFSFVTFLIPLIGPGISLLIPLIIAILHNVGSFTFLVIILAIVQQILLNVLLPKLYSRNTGIHPAIVVFAILVGFQSLGVIGALLALPVASVIQTLLKYYSVVEPANI